MRPPPFLILEVIGKLRSKVGQSFHCFHIDGQRPVFVYDEPFAVVFFIRNRPAKSRRDDR